MEKVAFFGRKELPVQDVNNAKVIRSEYGNKQIEMTSPRIVSYEKPERKTIYPKGFELHFFDGSRTKKASVRANYGISYDDRNIMKATDSVVIIDYRTGDTSYLKELIWNSGEHRIYSNYPVRSVNGQRVTIGDGFESDENFERPLILHQRGTVLIEE